MTRFDFADGTDVLRVFLAPTLQNSKTDCSQKNFSSKKAIDLVLVMATGDDVLFVPCYAETRGCDLVTAEQNGFDQSCDDYRWGKCFDFVCKPVMPGVFLVRSFRYPRIGFSQENLSSVKVIGFVLAKEFCDDFLFVRSKMTPAYSVGSLTRKTTIDLIDSMTDWMSYYSMTNYHDDSFFSFCFFHDFSKRMTRRNRKMTTKTKMMNWNSLSYPVIVSSVAVLSWASLCLAPDCLPTP
jgi:hypothetical protein